MATGEQHRELHDFTKRLVPALPDLLRALPAEGSQQLNGLEEHILSRMAGSQPVGWLSQFPAYAACKIAETIGGMEVKGPKFMDSQMTDDAWHEAGGLGFAIANQGPEAIHAFLQRTSDNSPKGKARWAPNLMFGRFYSWLVNGSSDPVFDPMRDILPQAVTDFTPFSRYRVPFAGSAEPRKMHSVNSAANATGRSTVMIKKVLFAAGIIDQSQMNLAPGEITFDAESNQAMLDKIKDAVEFPEMARYLNLPSRYSRTILAAGFVKSIIPEGARNVCRPLFHVPDLDAFLTKLAQDAKPERPGDPSVFPIAKATMIASCAMIDVVTMLLASRLRTVRLKPGERGFKAVLVNPTEVREALDRKVPGIVSVQEVKFRLRTSPPAVLALTRGGHLPSRQVMHPWLRKERTVITSADLDAFQARYVSAYVSSMFRGTSVSNVVYTMQRLNIAPAFDPGAIRSHFFERSKLPDGWLPPID